VKRLIIAFIALSGCSTDALLDAAYPDYERFQFATTDGDSILSYACAPGPSATETQNRAAQAHRFFERNINALAERAATGLIDRADQGQGTLSNAIALNRELNANVEEIVAQTESRFQCLMYDEQDA